MTLPKTCSPARTLLAALTLGTALGTFGLVASGYAQDSNASQNSLSNVPASLMADRISLSGSDTLVAEGAVEIYYEGNRVTAKRVTYDQKADTIKMDGPIRLTEPQEAGAVIVADQAELSRDLQHGILLGARMVMARELQLAAAKIERENGNVTTMTNVVASSCNICVVGERPLWEIRARKITHNAQERKLSFEDAQFRVAGVPLVWVPKLRLPDPTVTRMSGFLAPSFRSTSSLGMGIKIPYFFAIDPSQDLLVEPYISSGWTRTLGLRYRRAFNDGEISISGAFSNDSIIKGANRGYLFADGSFTLPDDFKLGLQLRMVSDDAYLLNYDVSDADRLWSGLTLERVRSDELIWARAGRTHSLREDEDNNTEPMLAGDAEWTRVYHPARIGGELTASWDLETFRRNSSSTTDGPDWDDIPDGRDMTRSSLTANWRRNWLLSYGIMASTQAQLAADAFVIRQDDSYDDTILRAQPQLATELRWPWTRSTGRAAHVIEPIAQIVWAPNNLTRAPNEDSTLREFDEGNLFSLSRYPGLDARERGLRANVGVSYTRYDAAGWSLGTTVGRVFYAQDLEQFSSESSLSGNSSDWLLASNLQTSGGLTVSNRAQFDDDFNTTREELRLAYSGATYDLAAGYLWMDSAILAGTSEDISELQLDSAWHWGRGWSGTFDARYDLIAERAAKAKLGVTWVNDCVSVDLSLSRRFTSSTNVDPETSVGLSVALAGFGGANDGTSASKVCVR
ncbi:LPS assembly protein LptD [Thioclava sp. GXIMD4216]|uniref:LPS-assembly protein LptD n=1 Tax=Thioclava litoralis TaxID=3076557 RepID=A0ABZ1E0N0_9RHOB|nr:LPS assembly protein LptD [Thioclava sp. FTW29]